MMIISLTRVFRRRSAIRALAEGRSRDVPFRISCHFIMQYIFWFNSLLLIFGMLIVWIHGNNTGNRILEWIALFIVYYICIFYLEIKQLKLSHPPYRANNNSTSRSGVIEDLSMEGTRNPVLYILVIYQI